MAEKVALITRENCGSCKRVAAQIAPIVQEAQLPLLIQGIETDPELAAEFGDRVPVVLIDDEEFACWEVDNEELRLALGLR